MVHKAVFSRATDGLRQIQKCPVVEVIADEPKKLVEAGISEGALECVAGAALSGAAETQELPGIAGVTGICDQQGSSMPGAGIFDGCTLPGIFENAEDGVVEAINIDNGVEFATKSEDVVECEELLGLFIARKCQPDQAEFAIGETRDGGELPGEGRFGFPRESPCDGSAGNAHDQFG